MTHPSTRFRLTPAVLAFLVVATHVARADSPPAVVTSHRVYSENRRFFVVSDAATKTVTAYRSDAKKRTKLWDARIESPNLMLSNDGRYLVAAHPDGNLIALAHASDEAVFSFYDAGRFQCSVRLSQLIEEKDLERTDSHYIWAVSYGFVGIRSFQVETADHKGHVFDPTNELPCNEIVKSSR